MAEKQIGFSLELLICPGETLQEVLDDRNMSRKELAIRTGVTEKHISKVINGKASITPEFASALEYAFKIDAEFWVNLQTNYDLERIELLRAEKVEDEEIRISRQLEKIRQYLVSNKVLTDSSDQRERVLAWRDFLGISKLQSIPQLQHCAAYRITSHADINPYVLFAWQKLCLEFASNHSLDTALDVRKLQESLPQIRSLVKLNLKEAIPQLRKILNECGIIFCVAKHFTGAPVQGYIERTETDGLIMCLTIRGAYVDIFWFTLFHEIAHILFDDTKDIYFDYTFEKNEAECRADQFASDALIPLEEYEAFITKNDFSLTAIRRFSSAVDIPTFVVIGRLQKEKIIPYTWYSSEKVRYKWKT